MNAWYSESSFVSVAIFSKECASSCSFAVGQIKFEALLFSVFPQMYVLMKKWHLKLIANVANIGGANRLLRLKNPKSSLWDERGRCSYGWWRLLATIQTRVAICSRWNDISAFGADTYQTYCMALHTLPTRQIGETIVGVTMITGRYTISQMRTILVGAMGNRQSRPQSKIWHLCDDKSSIIM